ncbi:C45 family autoproteolytic acyltransferase/hydolase [Gelidibacter sp. F63206]|uniref:C45 family autoproteolytic acyltransferase/hydolase n=1 Tax=Gelidibacter sp. F63206 TaxID=2926425 RepID=UPI001FF24D44|nr:C45 family peptidase [Gelidibacter sp. F63206]MCK0115271.1 C45 family peptidase [Gelidibacter sp. F63206]
MIRILFLFLVWLVSWFLNATPNEFFETKVPVITLSGTPFERGYNHGEKLKKPIAEVFQLWKQSIHKDTKRHPDSVISHFLKTTNYKKAISEWTPQIWEEIEGLAAGSGQSLDDVFAFQMIDEYWGYLDRLQNNSVDKDHCSAIGVAKNGSHPTMVAQNIDIDNFMNGYQVLFHIPENDDTPEQYIMSCAGFIGFAGMNNKGLAVVINALTDLKNATTGLPVTFVTRGLLQKLNSEDALSFVQNVKHATGQNYLIGTNDQVYSFEASANQVVQFNPHQNQLVYHTNHSLDNHDIKPWMEDYHKRILSGVGKQTNSQTRLKSLESQLALKNKDLGAETLKDILRSKENPQFPICVNFRDDGVAFTFSSVVFTLGENSTAEVTYGSPDRAMYHKHHFNK